MTHCFRGHEYTPENVYWHRKGKFVSRQCKACRRVLSNKLKSDGRQKLDEKATKRLLEAAADGVTRTDLQARFGLSLAGIDAVLKKAGR